MRKLISYLVFLFGVCIPFFVVGPRISNGLWLSPSILIGVLLVATSVLVQGLTIRIVFLSIMLFVFALTSAGRHAPDTYLFSLLMLFAVMAPMCVRSISGEQAKWLKVGFICGLLITLVLVWIEILSQVFAQDYIYRFVGNLFAGLEPRMNPHNHFVLYQRPQVAFSEPAHLAIYLSASLLILDLIGSRLTGFLRLATCLTIIAVGSMVGYVLLMAYVLLKLYNACYSSGLKINVIQISSIAFVLFGFGLLSMVLLKSTVFMEVIDKIFGRIMKTLDVLRSGDLVGSEASRVNVLPVLMDYWRIEGFPGVFFGTGYGNASDWLITNYGHLGGQATVGRGHFDNILVGISLTTGIFGLVFYMLFTVLCISRVGKENFFLIFIIFILLNFSTGFLIAYPIWHLMAIILLIAGAHKASRK